MTVDGSAGGGGNKIFKWDVPSGEEHWLETIQFFILDTGVMGHTVFGSLASALTNGLRLVVKKKGNETVIKDIKTNIDVLNAFPKDNRVGNNANGFLDENDYFYGALRFNIPERLVGDDGDLVKIVVRDDCQLIGAMCSECMTFKLVN